MAMDFRSKTSCRVYKIIGCFAAWIAYTYTISQILPLKSEIPNSQKLDFTQEAHETDQRASVCFKDVIPFSVPLIQGSEICRNKPDLLIIIHTEPDNFKMRFAYREEFANRIKFIAAKYDFTLDIIFLMGLNRKYCITTKNVEEVVIYKDILVGSFIDTYYNQTLKSITMLKWFVENCKSAKLLLKLDEQMDFKESFRLDDFYVLIRNAKEQNLITGSFNEVKRTISPESVPWISAPYLYPGLPQNLHQNYLLSRYSAESLLKAYTDSIYISVWKEDLYITGILATIAKLKIKHNEHFLTECGAKVCIFCDCRIPKILLTDQKTTNHAYSSLLSNETELAGFKNKTHLMPKRDAGNNSNSTSLTISQMEEITTIKIGIPEITTSINLERIVSTNENIDSSTSITGSSQDTTSVYPDPDNSTHEPTSTEDSTDEFSTEIPSTTTEFSEIISITDIGILEINEYELGLENQVYLPADEQESENVTENIINFSSRQIIFFENLKINASIDSFFGEYHNTMFFEKNTTIQEEPISNPTSTERIYDDSSELNFETTTTGRPTTENYDESITGFNTELESNATTFIP